MLKYILPLVLGLGLFSCEVTREEDKYRLEDYPQVTWEDPVSEILNTNCVPCHGPVLRYKGIRHDMYALEVKLVEDGRLKTVINQLPGYTRMPYQAKKLPPGELEILNYWIDHNAPEK